MIDEQRREITAPCCPPPSHALSQKFGIAFKRGRQLGFFAELDRGIPAVIDQVSCHEVVIVGRQQREKAKPSLFLEFVEELFVLDDPCPNSECATRETPNTTINAPSSR